MKEGIIGTPQSTIVDGPFESNAVYPYGDYYQAPLPDNIYTPQPPSIYTQPQVIMNPPVYVNPELQLMDEVAKIAVQELIRHSPYLQGPEYEELGKDAYRIAKGLIKERRKNV